MQAAIPDVVEHPTPHAAESAPLRGLDLDAIGARLVVLAEACTQEHLEMLSRTQADGLLALVRQGAGSGN